MRRFDSDDLAPRDRVEGWRDFAAQTLAALQSIPAGAHRFHVKADIRSVGEVVIGRLTGSGHISERTRYEVAKQRHHFYAAVVHLDGGPLVRSRHGSAHLQPGDISILSTMEKLWFGVEVPFDHIVVKFPERWPEGRILKPDLLCGSAINNANPLRGILADYVASVYSQADCLPASAATAVGHHVLELMSAAIAEEPIQIVGSAALRAAVFDKACRIITSRATDPQLRPDEVARQLKLSPRMLQRIFKEYGETVTNRIMCTRIHKSAEMLASERMKAVTITQIAFACGFSDLTTFERDFSGLQGSTPSSWRRRALNP